MTTFDMRVVEPESDSGRPSADAPAEQRSRRLAGMPTARSANGPVRMPTGVAGAVAATPVTVGISSLVLAASPRLSGEDTAHTRRLAEVDDLPPILVHRPTMRVVDGQHRVRAAMLNGRDRVEAVFLDGNEDAVFLLAVKQNLAHGLPLSLADRRAAAERIVAAFPQWSDRAVAEATGLSGKTVAAIRRRSTAEIPHVDVRVGRDGRARPRNVAEGRRRAGELIVERPDASLREIAREAGISPGTVQNVRSRLAAGQDPVLPSRPAPVLAPPKPVPAPPEIDHARHLDGLKRDPTLRFSQEGRNLLRWLHVQVLGVELWPDMLEQVPVHSLESVASLAVHCAAAWQEFADALESRQA